MSLYQNLYYMSLVGGMSGLFSWALAALVFAVLPNQGAPWLPDLVAAGILGAMIGGLTVGFSDHWAGNRVMPRWILSGTLIGLLAGLSAGFLEIPITNNLADSSPVLTRVIAWMLAGSMIGLGLGLRWVRVNRARVAHAVVGGLLGGTLGGLIFASLGSSVPDLSQALGFVFIGVGICFGVTLAPMLLRDAVLEFVSSGDPVAQYKFGPPKQKQWEIQHGDSYVLGSQSQDFSHTRYRPDIEIFIPDSGVAPRHAILFGREGRFFIARHPEAADQAAIARFRLRVRGKTVVRTQELHGEDDILLGKTALKFVARREGA